ncbi:MAG: hypothetical protein P4N59_13095 [Negativicutes bacterium]|nr:hypothetical protein [Negativicutes bacterium]
MSDLIPSGSLSTRFAMAIAIIGVLPSIGSIVAVVISFQHLKDQVDHVQEDVAQVNRTVLEYRRDGQSDVAQLRADLLDRFNYMGGYRGHGP